jgi:hypothetical protein
MTAQKARASASESSSKNPRVTIRVSAATKQQLLEYCLKRSMELGKRIGMSRGLEELLLEKQPARKRNKA